MSKFVWAMNKDCTIFYNAGHIGPRHRDVKDAFSHFELESLPSGGWGYMHFPMAVSYSRTLGLDCMGMTGKFHTSWGDFHSFKNLPALQFECFRMLAYGAKCSVGDQLAPDGKICPHVYDLIGKVYMEVERKEPWCVKAKPVVDIGLFTTEEVTGERVPPQTMAAARMLQESGHQFDIIDTKSKLTDYKVVILPDVVPADKKLAKKIRDYLDAGGAMIVSYKSGLNEDGNKFAIKKLGLKLKGDAPYSPDFIVPRGEIGKGLPQTEHVMYMKGLEVKAKKNADVLAEVVVPYFNRTHEHFCSHKHTPSAGRVGYPGIVRSGNIIYFAHPIFGQYAKNAPRWCKQLVLNALDMLLPSPVLRLNAPTTALATVNEQGTKRRWIVHLLHYIPERRCQDIDVIEDVIPIHDVGCSLRVGRDVKSVVCVPQEEALEFTMKDSRVEFTVPKVEGHQMVCVAFA